MPGGSILVTSAPKSDSTVAAAGAAIKLAQSRTFRPSKMPFSILASLPLVLLCRVAEFRQSLTAMSFDRCRAGMQRRQISPGRMGVFRPEIAEIVSSTRCADVAICAPQSQGSDEPLIGDRAGFCAGRP